MDIVTWLFVSLAVWRFARMIVGEQGPFRIFERIREAMARGGLPDWIVYGATCVACVSFWLALAPALAVSKNIAEVIVYTLSISAVSVILLRKVG
jgi:hypothetical protein